MKTPPLLLGTSLLFWGWQTNLLFFAMPLAIILESSRLLKFRWDFSTSDFIRISDLCTTIMVGTFIYLLISNRSFQNILQMFSWLPVFFFPLLFCESYSVAGKVDVRALSMVQRKKNTTVRKSLTSILIKETNISINLTYPYVVLCILSASVANIRTNGYYAGLFFLSTWAIWPIRPRRYSSFIWAALLILSGLAGYAGQNWLNQLQQFIENKGLEWVVNLERKDADPYQSMTALGSIGKLKPSNQILFRVQSVLSDGHPIHLREASYNSFRLLTWFSSKAPFTTVHPESDGTTWILKGANAQPRGDAAEEKNSLMVSSYLEWGKGMLKLPTGTFRIESLPVLTMEINPLGAVKVEGGPGLVTYQAQFNQNTSFDHSPDETDLVVPSGESTAILQIVNELNLTSKSPEEIVNRVSEFFEKNFNYSLRLTYLIRQVSPLADFLFNSRSGHCEYFATATVLLLRAAGVPARYATGYLVHEFDESGKKAVVREKDAHAWALAYINGSWRDIDTTPSAWIGIEADSISAWQFISDTWSWIVFQYSQWRWNENKSSLLKYLAYALIPIILFRYRKFFFKKRVKMEQLKSTPVAPSVPKPGWDSEFYLIEKRLNELGFQRHQFETISAWLKRIEKNSSGSFSLEHLNSLMEIHYRYRFDPGGITVEEKQALSMAAQSWIASSFPETSLT